MIYLHTANASDIDIKETEVLRYLGYGKTAPNAQVAARVESVAPEIQESLSPRACCRIVPVCVQNGTVDFGLFSVASHALSKNLAGCGGVLLFAATVGAEPDRLIRKYGAISPASAVIAQAVAAAAIESWCDRFLSDIGNRLGQEGQFLRPRFSPGYGDFALSYQKDLFAALDVPRKIGVSLTEALLMTPSKSVTAVVGISHTDTGCRQSGCEACTKRNTCAYARG